MREIITKHYYIQGPLSTAVDYFIKCHEVFDLASHRYTETRVALIRDTFDPCYVFAGINEPL